MRRLLAVTLALGLSGCLRFPQHLDYRVQVRPTAASLTQAGYYFDVEDSSVVFEAQGMRLKARFLRDAELNTEFATATNRLPNLNPFTYGRDRDLDLGYAPPRFTVVELTVVNQGLPKVRVDPATMRLVTDQGEVLPSWAVLRRDGSPSLEQYYMERRGEGGNEQHYFQERMGVVRQALYRRDTWVWQGDSYTGKVVFGPLRPAVTGVRLEVEGIVLKVDAYDRPTLVVEAVFELEVEQGVVGQIDGE